MKRRKKKMFNGGQLAQATTAINTSLINASSAIRARKLADKQALQAEKDGLNTSKKQDLENLEEFQEDGYALDTYYKKGGNLNTPPSSITGGKAQPLSSDSVIMKGKSHEQGGIDVGGGVEVEGEEVIKDGKKVFSDTLKNSKGITYADAAKKLSTKKGELEDSLAGADKYKRGSIERAITNIDREENMLFEEQQSKNGNANSKNAALGSFLPHVDNLTNSILTAFTPKVRKPTYVKAQKLETKVNVNDQVAGVNDAVDSASKFIGDNTSNSNVARNSITSARLQGAKQKAGIYAKKENIETSLKNANSRNIQQVDAVNARKTDAYNLQQTARQGAIQTRISDNAADFSDDVIDKRNFDESLRFNNESLAAVKTMYNNGVIDRTDTSYLEQLKKLLGTKK